MTLDPLQLPWRQGRRVGRTIYTVVGEEADGGGWLIGIMDTPALAREACDAHNIHLLNAAPPWTPADPIGNEGRGPNARPSQIVPPSGVTPDVTPD